MKTNKNSNKASGKLDKRSIINRIHDAACIVCALSAGRNLLNCILTVFSALDDMRKYSDLGGVRHFGYYLVTNGFFDFLVVFLWLSVSLAMYILLCRHTERKKVYTGSGIYFSAMLAAHVAMLIHSIQWRKPVLPEIFSAGDYYVFFAVTTLGPAIVYWFLYFLRIWICRMEEKAAKK